LILVERVGQCPVHGSHLSQARDLRRESACVRRLPSRNPRLNKGGYCSSAARGRARPQHPEPVTYGPGGTRPSCAAEVRRRWQRSLETEPIPGRLPSAGGHPAARRLLSPLRRPRTPSEVIVQLMVQRERDIGAGTTSAHRLKGDQKCSVSSTCHRLCSISASARAAALASTQSRCGAPSDAMRFPIGRQPAGLGY
jgi:hypothetical protein